MSVSASSHKHEYVIYECCQRAEGGGDIGVGGTAQGIVYYRLCLVCSDAGVLKPCGCPHAGVDFHRQGDEGKECGHGKQDDAAKHDLRECLDGQDTDEQNPLHPTGSETYNGHQRTAHLQGPVGRGMLYGMATFVCRHGRRRHGAVVIHIIAEVHGLVNGVVVVGKLAGSADDSHVVDTVVVQHLYGNILARHPVGKEYLAVFLEFALQVPLNQITHKGYNAE